MLLKYRHLRPYKLLVAGVILLVLTFLPNNAFASRPSEIAPVAEPEKAPSAYIVVDATNGTIVSSKNIHQPLNVASISKVVTALGAVNTLSKDKLITIPKEAEKVQPSKIGMKEGEKWKRDDLLYSLLLTSANDAAYALANASSGSIPDFARQQNRIAKELSMEDSTFGDPSGLDDNFAINGDTKMSAYDVAIAGRAVLAQPDLAKIVGTLNYQFVGGDGVVHTLTNHNDAFLLGYTGANGLKTGYTKKSGRTLMVSATRGKTTLIAVVLNVQQTNEWAAQLLDQGFNAISSGSVSRKAPKLPAIGVIGSKANVTILNEAPKSIKASTNKASNQSSDSKKSPLLSVPFISIFILLFIVALFFWRRRVIRKRKLQRRKKALAAKEAGRRAMMDIIDLTIEEESELVSKR